MSTAPISIPDPTTRKPARRRRSMPLSLRFFLSILGILGVAVGWQCLGIYRKRLAISEIERVGGIVQRAPGRSLIAQLTIGTPIASLFERGREVALINVVINVQRLADLRQMADVENLALVHTRVPENVLAGLEELPQLRLLSLDGTDITDAQLVFVGRITTLQTLNLARTAISDDGLARLAGSLPKLEVLNLTGTRVTNLGLAHLTGMKSLHRLCLDDTQVTVAGVAELQRALPGLSVGK